jgi:hypothetical protein
LLPEGIDRRIGRCGGGDSPPGHGTDDSHGFHPELPGLILVHRSGSGPQLGHDRLAVLIAQAGGVGIGDQAAQFVNLFPVIRQFPGLPICFFISVSDLFGCPDNIVLGNIFGDSFADLVGYRFGRQPFLLRLSDQISDPDGVFMSEAVLLHGLEQGRVFGRVYLGLIPGSLPRLRLQPGRSIIGSIGSLRRSTGKQQAYCSQHNFFHTNLSTI